MTIQSYSMLTNLAAIKFDRETIPNNAGIEEVKRVRVLLEEKLNDIK